VSLGLLEGGTPVSTALSTRLMIPPAPKGGNDVLSLIDDDIPELQDNTPNIGTPSLPLPLPPLPDWITSSLPGNLYPFISEQQQSPSPRLPYPKNAVVLNLQSYPFKSTANDLGFREQVTPGQLRSPPLPPFPSDDDRGLTRSEKRKRRREVRHTPQEVQEAVNCSCDVLASFEEKGGVPFK